MSVTVLKRHSRTLMPPTQYVTVHGSTGKVAAGEEARCIDQYMT